MKRILLLLLLFFSFFQAHAQLQPMISYQGELLDGGIPVDGTVTMTFQIGTWGETQSVSVQRGLYSVQLGAINPIPDTLFRDNPTLSLQISVNGASLFPNTVLLPVPYAFFAKHVGTDAVGSSQVLDGSLTPLDLQSPGADKVLITDSNGFVLWQDQNFALDDGDWTINPNSLTYGGRVGVGGVSLPTSALDIQGIIRLRDRGAAPLITTERLYNVGGDLFWNGTNLTGGTSTAWNLTGNAGTTAGTDFVGTTDAQDLVFKTNSNEVFRLYSTGEAFFGTPLPPAHTLSVNGTLGIRSGGSLQLEDANATFYSVFQTGTQAANLTYTLPIAGGAAGDVLTNDGTGVLSWSAPGLPALTNGFVFVGDGANTAQGVTMSGDLAIDNTGLTTIQADAVESAKILDGTIVTADLANDAVNTVNILDDNVTLAKIADGTADQMLTTDATGNPQWENKAAVFATTPLGLNDGLIFVGDGANTAQGVTMSGDLAIDNTGLTTIQADAVESAKILDGTIVTADLANDAVNTINILDDNVTLTKIADGTADQMLTTDATGNPQWENKAAVFATTPLGLNDGLIFVGDATNEAQGVTMSGDLAIDNTGLTTIQADAVESAKILDGTIVTTDLANDAVNTINILDDNVTLTKIADGTADQMLTTDATGNPQWENKAAVFATTPLGLNDGLIFVGDATNEAQGVTMSGDLAIDNTGLTTIQADAVESAKILDGTIVTTDLANDAVNTINILDDNVTLTKIADGTADQMLTTDATGNPQWENKAAVFATTPLGLNDGLIFVGDATNEAQGVTMSGDLAIDNTGLTTIQADAVESAKILDGTIVTTDLANDAVNTINILDDNVTLAKIADGTADQMLTTDATGNPQWENKAAVFAATPLGLNDGLIFVGDGANTAQGVTMSGDLAIDNTGLTTIQADAVESAKILDGTIVTADLANDAVNTINILDDNVTLAKIADGTADQMLTTDATGNPQWEDKATVFAATPLGLNDGLIFVGDGANTAQGVTMSGDLAIDNTGLTTIQADAVESAKILDGTIVTADLANDAVNTINILDDNVTLAKIADGTADQMLTTDATGNPQWEDKATLLPPPLVNGEGMTFSGSGYNLGGGNAFTANRTIDLSANNLEFTSTSGFNTIIDGAGAVTASQLRVVNSTSQVSFAVATGGAPYTLNFPPSQGLAGDILENDGLGNLNWTSPSVGNSLNEAYNKGGPGAGRTINAVDGTVLIGGEDGFSVTGPHGIGLSIGSPNAIPGGAGTRMFFNTRKSAFRAGAVANNEWDDPNVGEYSSALGRNTIASGNSSTALGQNTTASGGWSAALGVSTVASGDRSIALGQNAIASGNQAVAAGNFTVASGNSSTALGIENTAHSYGEIAVGLFATNYTPNSIGAFDAADRVFTVGNGLSAAARSNALTVFKNGTVRIDGLGGSGSQLLVANNNGDLIPLPDGVANDILTTDGAGSYSWVAPPSPSPTLTPGEGLSFTPGVGYDLGGGTPFTANRTVVLGGNFLRFNGSGGDVAILGGTATVLTPNLNLANGPFELNLTASSLSANYTLNFPANQGAAGEVLENDGSGNLSWAAPAGGNDLNQAYNKGGPGAGRTIDAVDGTVLIGGEDGFSVTGPHGIGLSIGSPNAIPGGAGTRMFFNTRKSAFRAGAVTGIQWDDANVGNYSAAMGQNTTASGDYSMAIGQSAVASGQRSISMGQNTTASGDQAFAVGSNSIASGSTSMAIGVFNEAHSYGETVVGLFATDYTPASAVSINAADRVFTVGIGTSGAARLNALTVFKNGIVRVDGLGGSGNRLLIGDNNGDLTALPDGAANEVLTTDGLGNYAWSTPSSSAWDLSGNAGTTASDFIGTTDNQALIFKTNNLEHMNLSTSGDFWVGNPNSYIEFNAGGSSRMGLGDGAGNEAGFIRGFSAGGSDNMITIAGTDDGGSSPVFFNFHSNGNLGIQTAAPQERIHLEANNNRAAFRLDGYSPNPADYSSLKLNRSDGTVGGGNAVAAGNSVGAVEFNAFDGASNFEPVARILTRTKGLVAPGGTPGELRFEVGNGGSLETAMTINELGNVGINTPTPSERLDVNGNIVATGTITPSDRRYKTEIQSLESSLDKIMRLRGVSYFWRHDEFPDKEFRKGKDFGFIAQEIEEILPEVVITQKNGYKGVDYTRVIPHLTAALQEQQAQIEALKKENEALKAKAEKQDNQEARLNAMEAQLAELRRALGLGENKAEKAAENTGDED